MTITIENLDGTAEAFTFCMHNAEGDRVVISTASADGVELLSLADAFKRFLNATGFNYVTEVVIVKSDEDDTVSSNDDF